VSLKQFFKDIYFWVAGVIGVVLMMIALHFNINPVEASVVPESIQGTWIVVFLFVTCMPGWILGYIIGYLLSFIVPLPFTLMVCATQFFLFGLLGKLIRRGVNALKAH
jgi:hypothetical protein